MCAYSFLVPSFEFGPIGSIWKTIPYISRLPPRNISTLLPLIYISPMKLQILKPKTWIACNTTKQVRTNNDKKKTVIASGHESQDG